jgi:atypical dual specificity phosphatase
MLQRFFWLIEGELAGSSCPGIAQPGQRGPMSSDELSADLSWLRGQGIGAVLTLTEAPLLEAVVNRHGLAMLHLPVPDLHPPSTDELLRALNYIDRQRLHGRPVVVHCLMGQGRTGTVLAAYWIRGGKHPDLALQELRVLCPGAVGSPSQEEALRRFAARRDWML